MEIFIYQPVVVQNMVMLKGFSGLVKGKLGGQKVPLKVQHLIDFRCNFRCSYCEFPHMKTKELDTQQIKDMMLKFVKAGTISWTFTGGEPLLRRDLGELVLYAKKLGLHVCMNTNGSLVKHNIDWLHNLDQLTLSLDGLGDINDKSRGKGTFDQIMEAINLIKKNDIELFLISVLNKENLKNDGQGIKDLLRFAKKTGAKMMFVPIHEGNLTSRNLDLNNTSPEELKRGIEILKEFKKKNGKQLVMSGSALDQYHSLGKCPKCYAGQLFCTIFPDGSVGHCLSRKDEAINGGEPVESFKKLPKINDCVCNTNCYVEYNHLLSLSPKSIIEFTGQYFK